MGNSITSRAINELNTYKQMLQIYVNMRHEASNRLRTELETPTPRDDYVQSLADHVVRQNHNMSRLRMNIVDIRERLQECGASHNQAIGLGDCNSLLVVIDSYVPTML